MIIPCKVEDYIVRGNVSMQNSFGSSLDVEENMVRDHLQGFNFWALVLIN